MARSSCVPLPFEKPGELGELVTIDVTSSRGFRISTSMPNYRDWRDRSKTLAACGGFTGWTFRLARSGETKIMDGAAVHGDLFGVLRIRPSLGRVFQPGETEPGSRPLVMLSHSTWVTQFGADSAIVGTAIIRRRFATREGEGEIRLVRFFLTAEIAL